MNKTVADYVCWLEKAFRVAFGNDKLSKEAKETMLYSQLQKSLHLGILRNPSVSGVIPYKELHIEQHQTELKSDKTTHNSFANKGRYDD